MPKTKNPPAESNAQRGRSTITAANLLVLTGVVQSGPFVRPLKTGEHVVNFDVRVKSDVSRTDVLPISWFEAPASALEIRQGDEICVVGRMRRQWFAGKANFTDVVAHRVISPCTPARMRRALGEAMAALQAGAP